MSNLNGKLNFRCYCVIAFYLVGFRWQSDYIGSRVALCQKDTWFWGACSQGFHQNNSNSFRTATSAWTTSLFAHVSDSPWKNTGHVFFFSLMQNNDRTHYFAEKVQIEKKTRLKILIPHLVIWVWQCLTQGRITTFPSPVYFSIIAWIYSFHGKSQLPLNRKRVLLCDTAVTHEELHVVSCVRRLDDVQAA